MRKFLSLIFFLIMCNCSNDIVLRPLKGENARIDKADYKKNPLHIVYAPGGYAKAYKQGDYKSGILERLKNSTFVQCTKYDDTFYRYIFDFDEDNVDKKIFGYIQKNYLIELNQYPIKKLRSRYKTGYLIIENKFSFGDAVINFLHIESKKGKFNPLDSETGYLEISRKNREPVRYYYPSMDPLGGSCGLIKMPVIQEKYLAYLKHGSYDNRIIIINKNGDTANFSGDFFTVFNDVLVAVQKYSPIGKEANMIFFHLKKWKILYDLGKNQEILLPDYNQDINFFTNGKNALIEIFWHDKKGKRIFEYTDQKLKSARSVDGCLPLKKYTHRTK